MKIASLLLAFPLLASAAVVDDIQCNVVTKKCVVVKLNVPNMMTREQAAERQKGIDAKCAERKSDRATVEAAGKSAPQNAAAQAEAVAAMARLTQPEPEQGCR